LLCGELQTQALHDAAVAGANKDGLPPESGPEALSSHRVPANTGRMDYYLHVGTQELTLN
jgi:hypothetical protein